MTICAVVYWVHTVVHFSHLIIFDVQDTFYICPLTTSSVLFLHVLGRAGEGGQAMTCCTDIKLAPVLASSSGPKR